MDRHWGSNRTLDPNTTNAPINSLLHSLRLYAAGVKLAGAGGGGFLIILAKGNAEAATLWQLLSTTSDASSARLYECRICDFGMRCR